MLELKNIIVGSLPEAEQKRLLGKLKKETDLNVFCVQPKEMDRSRVTLFHWMAGNSILVSDNAAQLITAYRVGMAALGYLNESEDGASVSVREFPADMYAQGMEEVDVPFLERVYRRHHGLPWTILETKRCIVREFCMDDLDDLFELYAGEGMTDYIDPLYPYEKEREYQEGYIECMYGFYGYGMWVVIDRKTGKLMGRIGIENRELAGGGLELGYVVAVPFQRKGYAFEVCSAVISYVKEELHAPLLNCLIEEGNTVSEHLSEKLGFAYEETIMVGEKRMKKYTLYLK